MSNIQDQLNHFQAFIFNQACDYYIAYLKENIVCEDDYEYEIAYEYYLESLRRIPYSKLISPESSLSFSELWKATTGQDAENSQDFCDFCRDEIFIAAAEETAQEITTENMAAQSEGLRDE